MFAVVFIYKDYILNPVSLNIIVMQQKGTIPLLKVESLPFWLAPCAQKAMSLSFLSGHITTASVLLCPLATNTVPSAKVLPPVFAIKTLGNTLGHVVHFLLELFHVHVFWVLWLLYLGAETTLVYIYPE